MTKRKKNLPNLKRLNLPIWRKMTMANWGLSGDSSTYARVSLPVDKVLKFIDQINSESENNRVTLTHFSGKALAAVYRLVPELNRIMLITGYFQRQDVDMFFLIASDPNGKDLTGKVIHDTDKKSLVQISQELNKTVKNVRKGKEKPLGMLKKVLAYMPITLIKQAQKALSFLLYSVDIKVPFLKLPPNPFGSAMITNVGSLGIELAFSPLTPFTRVPCMMSIGSIQKRLIFDENKNVVEEQYIEMGFTVDHRYIDGVHGGKISRALTRIFNEPELMANNKLEAEYKPY